MPFVRTFRSPDWLHLEGGAPLVELKSRRSRRTAESAEGNCTRSQATSREGQKRKVGDCTSSQATKRKEQKRKRGNCSLASGPARVGRTQSAGAVPLFLFRFLRLVA